MVCQAKQPARFCRYDILDLPVSAASHVVAVTLQGRLVWPHTGVSTREGLQ